MSTYNREYYLNDRSTRVARQKAYYKKNKKKVLAYQAKYRKQNPQYWVKRKQKLYQEAKLMFRSFLVNNTYDDPNPEFQRLKKSYIACQARLLKRLRLVEITTNQLNRLQSL